MVSSIDYLRFTEVEPSDLLPVLNSSKIRRHLIDHELFTVDTLTTWMDSKIEVDGISGCRIRAVVFNRDIVGWCGIQLDGGKYEIAIIIDDKCWGLGKKVFQDMMGWAKEFGHKEVYINFLHTRPEYKFLKDASLDVYQTEIYGSAFTTYQLAVV